MNVKIGYTAVLALAVLLLPVSSPVTVRYAAAKQERIITGRVAGISSAYIIVKRKIRGLVHVYRFYIVKDTVTEGVVTVGAIVSVEYYSVRRPNRKRKFIARRVSVVK